MIPVSETGRAMRSSNRTDAGHRLASRLKQYEELEHLVVVGLLRGGVPVAVAEQLAASVDMRRAAGTRESRCIGALRDLST